MPMTDQELMKRLPYHAPKLDRQVKRILGERGALGVITKGEEGVNLYPGPNTKGLVNA